MHKKQADSNFISFEFKHDENKVKILGAFAMIVNKHKDDVLVKPLANKNVKKNQKTS